METLIQDPGGGPEPAEAGEPVQWSPENSSAVPPVLSSGHTAPLSSIRPNTAQGLCRAFPLHGYGEAVVMERHLVVPDSWNSLDFSTEQVLVQTCAVLGVVELDLASSQGTVKTSVMSTTTTSTHWVLKPCLEF